MKHNFDEIINRVGTDSYKWDHEGEMGKYIPLGVADTDFRTADEIIRQLRKKTDYGLFAYGDFPVERFASAVREWYKKRFDVEVHQDWIWYAQGLMTSGLWMLLEAYTRPGDRVIIQSPVYNTFRVVIEGAGRFVTENRLSLKDGCYEIDFEDLERQAKNPKTRVLLLCNPHNPVGRIWKEADLRHMIKIAKENHMVIISDELHQDLTYQEGFRPLFDVACQDDPVVVMSGPSKTFNTAALYSAYIVSKNPTLMEQYRVVYDNHHTDYNMFGTEALITAYTECEYYADQLKEYLWQNIQMVRDFLRKHMPNIHMEMPEATYLLWLDCRALGLGQNQLTELFATFGVRLNSGINYGQCGAGFMRMNVACPRKRLREALGKMESAYDSLELPIISNIGD